MPYDTYSNPNVSIEYDNCINCLEELLSQYEQDDIIMCGDWNTSRFRKRHLSNTIHDGVYGT